MGFLLTSLKRADIEAVERLIEQMREEFRVLKMAAKADRARVAKCERLFRESLQALMVSSPVVEAVSDELFEEEDAVAESAEIRRLRVPELRQ